jgi:hypothetical protein
MNHLDFREGKKTFSPSKHRLNSLNAKRGLTACLPFTFSLLKTVEIYLMAILVVLIEIFVLVFV